MMLSLPSNNQSMDTATTYTLPEQRTKSIRRSFWRMAGSLRRKRSSTTQHSDTASISTCSSSSDGGDNGSYPVSSSSSLMHLSDTEETPSPVSITVTPPPLSESTTPANHPPAHVFGKADQGYSMFYLKLPNGNWMVRCRTADRKIIATYEVDGSMV